MENNVVFISYVEPTVIGHSFSLGMDIGLHYFLLNNVFAIWAQPLCDHPLGSSSSYIGSGRALITITTSF